MIDFVAGGGLSSKLAKRLKVGMAIFVGCWTGILWGKTEWSQRKEWCNANNITDYECEDQINSLIEKTNKPAVMYYYYPMSPYHYLFRSYMFKYSNRYPQNATWVMVNLTQHLQPAKEALRNIIFPLTHSRIEVRFPRTQLAIYESNSKDQLKLAKQIVGNRREVYNYDYFETNFEAFLEEHKVVKGIDPVMPVLKLTQISLFQN